jgi:beta-glucosidase/6-phospho-beta-glucosidase/beta-galactosidase
MSDQQFGSGDRVYHREMNAVGTFEKYHHFNKDAAEVTFDDARFGIRWTDPAQLEPANGVAR